MTTDVVATRLRAARELAGLSQGQVAKKMGMHRPTISEIEAGRRRVTANELREFATLYRTSITWLTGDDPEVLDKGDAKLQLAARELAKLSKDDFDRVIRILSIVRGRESPL